MQLTLYSLTLPRTHYSADSDAGKQTCAGRPGSYGFEKEDAASYAEWQVDYLKCACEGSTASG